MMPEAQQELSMDRWLINGAAKTTVSVEDRGFAYGDGLFETMALRNGRVRFLDAHLTRLQSGCERLAIPFDCSAALIAEIQQITAHESHGILKLILSRGAGPRGYALPLNPKPLRCLGFAAGTPSADDQAPAVIRICRTPIARNRLLAGLKTLNRLEQVMARAEWTAADGFDEGLMLDDRGVLVCGTMSNLFVVANDALMTPALDECGINGVMRAQVIALAGHRQIPVHETTLQLADLYAADGVFLTNAVRGIWPVAEIAGKACASHSLIDALQMDLQALTDREASL